MAGLLLWIIKCIKVGSEEVRKSVSFAEDIPCSEWKTEPAREPAMESPFT